MRLQRSIWPLLAITLLSACVVQAQMVNPKAVAQLKWYKANQNSNTQLSIATTALGFDGENVWSGSSGQIVKIRPSDNEIIGSYSYPSLPSGNMAFDGANLWVLNTEANSVSKVRASDGTVMGTFMVGHAPLAVVFDGASIWVFNQDATIGGTVMILRPSDGAKLYTISPVTSPMGALFDGTNMWVSATDVNGLAKLSSSGAKIGVIDTSFAPGPGLIFDGKYLFVGLGADQEAVRVDPSSGTVTSWFGDQVYGMLYDGQFTWLQTAVGLQPLTDSQPPVNKGTYGPSSTETLPLVFDGAHLWVSAGASLWKL